MPSNSPADEASSNRDGHALASSLRRLLIPPSPPRSRNPALAKHSEERAKDAQNRLADRITTFAGSMTFVYVHILWFGCWIGFGVERYPFGLLTMIVSLEAIFLSTFVLISQNRADAKRRVMADQQWATVQEEDTQNQELLDLMKQTLTLVKDMHSASGAGGPSQVASSGQTGNPGTTS